MTKWLASIKSLQEAKLLEPVFPDILDIKDPSRGALGALTVAEVADIVSFVAKRCQTSATIGDLAMEVNVIKPAIIEMASSGVDFVKIGLFPAANLQHCLAALADTLHKLKTPVIAVLFADKPVAKAIWPVLKTVGFQGVMVDTALKNGQHLLDHWDRLKLQTFVTSIQEQGLLCGLAGALRHEDIATLKPLSADYLGFRSALCRARHRTAQIELNRVETISNAIHSLPD
ncbi:MAG: (5-formylfuran-3-yl)methyl phosphate synthase [Gammaproteobacteria bacterium]|nr:(5-formylfuran-3-yl)methyl phosphate synthase [Gammaproteobacteria bacterium]